MNTISIVLLTTGITSFVILVMLYLAMCIDKKSCLQGGRKHNWTKWKEIQGYVINPLTGIKVGCIILKRYCQDCGYAELKREGE